MAAILKTSTNKNAEKANKQKDKKLSKIGEWLRSGQSALTIIDMKAVLL
jgi:hypothetical protein